MLLTVIVEDDPMVMDINRQYMDKISDVKVTALLRSGSEALNYMSSHKVDLILMDMFMPKMSGLEVLRQLRNSGNQADVIMVTANNSTKDIKDAISLGIIDYLIKPFEFERLKTAVNKCIAKRSIIGSDYVSPDTLSQEDIDRIFCKTEISGSSTTVLDKGIQASTLQALLQCLTHSPDESVLCETLATSSGLSKVTVRRYMNYLIENDQVESITDYCTGGRPAIRYRIKNRE